MRYQETWVRGETLDIPAQRSCADRYEPVHDFLQQYDRGHSMFDLGANLGYFSFRAAEDFGTVCVMVDNRPELGGLAAKNDGLPVMWLNTRMGASNLAALSTCESFDVVLALSVLHHFGDQWRPAFDALRKLGSHVIVELPAPDDTGSINGHLGASMSEYVTAIDGVKLLAEFPSHKSGKPRPMFLVPGSNPQHLIHQSVDASQRGAPPLRKVEVTSDWKRKFIYIQHGDVTGNVESREFIHGMNLWNFRQLGGTWPHNTEKMLRDAVDRMDTWHDDLRPWNFIVDGLGVYAIDHGNKAWRKEPEPNGLEKCLQMLRTGVSA